jgi:hypothetical protein
MWTSLRVLVTKESGLFTPANLPFLVMKEIAPYTGRVCPRRGFTKTDTRLNLTNQATESSRFIDGLEARIHRIQYSGVIRDNDCGDNSRRVDELEGHSGVSRSRSAEAWTSFLGSEPAGLYMLELPLQEFRSDRDFHSAALERRQNRVGRLLHQASAHGCRKSWWFSPEGRFSPRWMVESKMRM